MQLVVRVIRVEERVRVLVLPVIQYALTPAEVLDIARTLAQRSVQNIKRTAKGGAYTDDGEGSARNVIGWVSA